MKRLVKIFGLRCSKQEKQNWQQRAQACGLSLSAWMRFVVTHGRDPLAKDFIQ